MSAGYSYRHQVHFEETNLVGNVYFVNYVRWQGHCREQFLFDHAPGVVKELESGALAMVTVSVHVDYLDECFAGDVIEVQMRQGGSAAGGRRLTMEFSYRRGQVLVAVGKQIVACMRRSGPGGRLEPAVNPPELVDALDRFRP